MGWIIPRRRARSRTTKQMNKWGEFAKAHPVLGTAHMKEAVPVLSRYERARLRGIILGERSINKFFKGTGGSVTFYGIALTSFCGFFAGFGIVWILWVLFMSLFPMLRAVRIGSAEQELEGIVKVAVYRAYLDEADKQGITVETVRATEGRERNSRKEASRPKTLTLFRKIASPVVARLRDDASNAALMLRSDVGLLVVTCSALALGLGISKYRSDVSTQIQYSSENLGSGCMAPLLATANHFIVHLHEADEAALLPHDTTSYLTAGACGKRPGAALGRDKRTPVG